MAKVEVSIETFLPAASVFVMLVLLVSALLHDTLWYEVLVMIALVVGGMNFFLYTVLYRRQRKLRRQTICEVREMLHDSIKNQLAIVRINAEMPPVEEERRQKIVKRIDDAVDTIDDLLEGLSEERLEEWKSRYRTSMY